MRTTAVLALPMLALLAGCTATPPTPADPVASDVCAPGAVTATVDELEPAASSRSLRLTLQNTGTVDCPLVGPPDVELLADGAPSPTTVEHGDLAAGRVPVDVVPAEFAVTVRVEWRVVPSRPVTDPQADCPTVDTLRIRLTPGSEPIEAPVAVTACDGGTLLVTPYDINAG